MANEWVKVELYGANNDGNPIRYTIADGVSVSKGQVLELIDNRTVQVNSTVGQLANMAGIALEEHIANQGKTTIAAWTDGIFRAVVSGASITVGEGCWLCGANDPNEVCSAAITTHTSSQIRAFDTGTDGTTISVRLKV